VTLLSTLLSPRYCTASFNLSPRFVVPPVLFGGVNVLDNLHFHRGCTIARATNSKNDNFCGIITRDEPTELSSTVITPSDSISFDDCVDYTAEVTYIDDTEGYTIMSDTPLRM
jgi:hypothetical protein